MLLTLNPNRFVALLALFFSTCYAPMASAVIRDGGIDPSNMGRGSWIYIMPNAINQLGGNVPSVTSLKTLMTYMKNQGLQYVTIKAAQGNTVFLSGGTPQFTAAVVEAGHAAGLKVFGYIYTTGADVPGEVAMVNYIFQQGADGLIYDAEGEWESNTAGSTVGNNGPALATQLCSTVRSNWPNKFMGLSTWPYRGVHTTLPYKEFAYYCDVIMPQAYWIELSDTPTECVTRVNNEWNSWKSTLTGKWTNAIKPFIMSGQGWSSASGTLTPAQIGEFETILRTISNPVSPGGFKGVDYWRAELHPASAWNAIRTNFISKPYTNAPVIQYVPAVTVGATNATFSWPTDQSSDSMVEHGLTTSYGTTTTNATLLWYHTVSLSGLSPNTTYHYRVKSKGTNNLVGLSADYVFTTVSAAVSDIVIDQDPANNTGGNTVAYAGTWTGNTTGTAYLGTFRYANPAYALGTPNRTATFTPNIVTAGSYNVYASWASSAVGGNRCTNAPFRINNGTSTTISRVNQEGNGNTFVLIASNKSFPVGTSSYIELGNDVTSSADTGDIVVADAVKLVFVPPPPSAPVISTPPQPQTVVQGNSATFSVVAGGTAPLVYQWRRAGTNISGATGSSYTRNDVQSSDAGNYSVVIANSVGTNTSANALLTVNLYPVISSGPQNVTTNSGASVTFSVTAGGTAPLSYQWQFEGSNIVSATGSSYTLNNVQASHAGNYSVIVSNIAGTAASGDALLTILQPQPPHIDFITALSDGRAKLQISGSPGHYGIDRSTNLSTNISDWSELTNFTTTTNVFEYIDLQTNLPLRFYRAKTISP